jgi:tetratricopeptide (TPR) repeat protein
VNLGIALTEGKRPEAALEWLAKAVTLLKPLAERKPPATNAQSFLRNAHSNRAHAFIALKRYKEAIPDCDRAYELSREGDRWKYRLDRADALLGMGVHAAATADADAVAKASGATGEICYHAARTHAKAVAAAGNDLAAADRYSDRAVDLLRQAVLKGFNDAGKSQTDPAFNSIRSREAFKRLIAEFEAKGKQ